MFEYWPLCINTYFLELKQKLKKMLHVAAKNGCWRGVSRRGGNHDQSLSITRVKALLRCALGSPRFVSLNRVVVNYKVANSSWKERSPLRTSHAARSSPPSICIPPNCGWFSSAIFYRLLMEYGSRAPPLTPPLVDRLGETGSGCSPYSQALRMISQPQRIERIHPMITNEVRNWRKPIAIWVFGTVSAYVAHAAIIVPNPGNTKLITKQKTATTLCVLGTSMAISSTRLSYSSTFTTLFFQWSRIFSFMAF